MENSVSTTLRELQGTPESGRVWEECCSNKALHSAPLNFKSTTYDETIYKDVFTEKIVYLLKQVDDYFMLACTKESTAKEIDEIIGSLLKLPI